jgi:hypothetical protein
MPVACRDRGKRGRTAAKGKKAKNDARPHAACPRARTSTRRGSVWRQDEDGGTMPVACRDREKAMPDARWRGRVWWTKGDAQRQLQARPLHGRSDCLSQVVEAASAPGEGVDQDTASPLTAPRAGHYRRRQQRREQWNGLEIWDAGQYNEERPRQSFFTNPDTTATNRQRGTRCQTQPHYWRSALAWR